MFNPGILAGLTLVLSGGLIVATCWAIAATTAARHWYRVAAAENRRSHRYRRDAVAFTVPTTETPDLPWGMP